MFAVPLLIWVITFFYAMLESGQELAFNHCRQGTLDALLGKTSTCATVTPQGQDLTINTAPAIASRIVAYAKGIEGLAYVYGGPTNNDCTNPNGIDCSGLTRCAALQASGGQLNLTHFTVTQQAQLAKYSVDKNSPNLWQPGDFIYYFIPADQPVEPGHTAIYIGAGRVIHAPHTGTVVQEGSYDMGPGTYITGVRRPALAIMAGRKLTTSTPAPSSAGKNGAPANAPISASKVGSAANQ